MYLNIPNSLTLFRILVIPIMIYLFLSGDSANRMFASLIFLIAIITDYLDGVVARSMNQQTKFGEFLDPVADKLLISSTFVMLVLLGDIPFWLVLLVVCRDVGIVGGYLILYTLGVMTTIRPTVVSKVNTALQILLVTGVLLTRSVWSNGGPVVEGLIIAVTITTVASSLQYIYNELFENNRRVNRRLE